MPVTASEEVLGVIMSALSTMQFSGVIFEVFAIYEKVGLEQMFPGIPCSGKFYLDASSRFTIGFVATRTMVVIDLSKGRGAS